MGQMALLFWKSWKTIIRSKLWTAFEILLPLVAILLVRTLQSDTAGDMIKMRHVLNAITTQAMRGCASPVTSLPRGYGCIQGALSNGSTDSECAVAIKRRDDIALSIDFIVEKGIMSNFPPVSEFYHATGVNGNVLRTTSWLASELSRGTEYNVIIDMLQAYEPDSHKDPKMHMLDSSLAAITVFICSFVPLICSIHVAREIAVERQTMIKDYLLVMGMSRPMYFFHHYAIAVLKALVGIVAIPAMLVQDSVLLAFCFFLAFFLFVSGCIAIGICIGAVCKKPSIATFATLLVIILGPIFAFTKRVQHVSHLLSLASYVSPFHGFLGALEIITEAFQRDEHTEFRYVATFPEVLIMMAIGNAIPIGMAIIFDYISSSTDNVFGMLCSKDIVKHEDDLPPLDNANEVDPQLDQFPVDVELVDIHKTWSSGERAVRGIDLKLYRGQVTVLLGHNGAGKSTTFAMISGMVVPSAGRMRIGENVIGEGEKAETSSIGFCPQYNPMFPNLTVRENLRFFAKLKGLNKGWKEESERLIQTLQLQDHSNALASTLSGGQKRKLCVAISLVGGSKVVLLDEPSAGMDTGARRDMERMLSEYKKERTFLLTTHYTDEAENLGDRILIMANGKIVCSGTSQFLNQRFGAGYILSAVAKDTFGVVKTSTKLLAKIKEIVPNARLQRQHGQQIEVWMSKDETPKFARLFRVLESIGGSLGLESFGLSLNTLEQVFLKVGELTGTRDREGQVRSSISELFELGGQRVKGPSKVLRQFLAAFHKRALYDKSNIFGHILSLVFTVLGVLVAAWFAREIESAFVPSITLARTDLVKEAGPCYRIGVKGPPEFVHKFEQAALTDPSCIIISQQHDLNEWYNSEKMVRPMIAAGIEVVPFSESSCNHRNVNDTDIITDDVIVRFGKNIRPVFAVVSFVDRALTGTEIKFNQVVKIVDNDTIDAKQVAPSEMKNAITMFCLLFIVFPNMVWKVANFYIVDRTSKFAHQQLLTGLSTWIYWISGLLWDLAVFCVYLAAVATTLWITHQTVDLHIILPMFTLSFMVIALRSYIISLFVDSKSKANIFMLLLLIIAPFVTFCAWFLLKAASLLLTMGDETSGKEWFRGLTIIEFLDPIFPIPMVYISSVVEDGRDLTFRRNLGCLAVQVLIHVVIFIGIQLARRFAFISRQAPPENSWETRDAEVEAEKKAIEYGQEKDLVLEVNQLVKWYGKSCAVRGVSFGVHEHECFGLLGANGAGKTTAFEILTGNSHASAGKAIVAGVDCAQLAKIGYCPQFDALLGDLTGRQCLRILAAMHGYTSPWRVADIIVTCVGMDEHGDKKTKSYSGGQRRKISVGIALLAQSSLIILDEPTAGIDPVARRDIWTVLVALRDGTNTAIVLTSHSMDEVEALCSRVAIMKKGRIIALGSAQSLKSKYGDHYKFSIVLSQAEEPEKVANVVLGAFPHAHLESGAATRTINFEIPREAHHKWSELFDSASVVASQLNATDFCLAQASLEDAFAAVAMDHTAEPSPYTNGIHSSATTAQQKGVTMEMRPLLNKDKNWK